MRSVSYTHLDVYKRQEYSLLDGACRIRQLLDTAQSRGDRAVAITDHGVMYGAVEFYKEAKKRGIHPVIGCKVYVAQRSRFDKVQDVYKRQLLPRPPRLSARRLCLT